MASIVERNRRLLSSADQTPASRIVQALRERGVSSSAELARISGLGKATISRAVKELRESGILIDAADRMPNGNSLGRPATGLILNPDAGVCVGLAIGPRSITATIGDVSHAVLASKTFELELDYNPQVGVVAARELVSTLLRDTGLSEERVLGIGIAVGGPVNPRTGKVSRSSLIPAWTGISIGDAFGAAFDRPVFVENESNCCALAELMWGAGVGCSDFIYIKLDQGLGGAIVIDGRVSRGVCGGAGEFGHITFDANGPLCRCGNRGCYELYAAGPALMRELSVVHGSGLTVERAISLAEEGDIGCQRALADIGIIVGRLAATLSNAINPELIIIGGELARAGDLLLDSLRTSFNRNVLLKGLADGSCETKIVAGTQMASLPSFGAIGLVLKELGREKASHRL